MSHLSNNVHDYLQRTHGKTTVGKIITELFGDNSEVLNSNSHLKFIESWNKFENKWGSYFEERRLNKLHDDVWTYVVSPGIRYPSLAFKWMNQRVEVRQKGAIHKLY